MKQYLSILFLSSFFVFTSCEDILECIVNVRPELEDKQLNKAYLDGYYFETIAAEIKNEPYDNGYYYSFNVTGNVPEGIDIIYEYRKIILEGIPEKRGRYSIRVSLYAEAIDEYYYDEDGNERYHDPLCSNNASRVYILDVR